MYDPEYLGGHRELDVTIYGGKTFVTYEPIRHFATLAAMLAGRWTRVKRLRITYGEWRVGDSDLPVLVCLYSLWFLPHRRVQLLDAGWYLQ